MSPLEIYRDAYRAGYFYGRIDADRGAPYDDRTPLEKNSAVTPSPSPPQTAASRPDPQ